MKLIYFFRKVKKKLFGSMSIPKDIDKFLEDLNNIDDHSLDEIQRSYYAYKMKFIYTNHSKKTIFLKKLIYSICFIFMFVLLLFRKKPNKVNNTDIIYYKVSNNVGIIPNSFYHKNIIEVPIGTGMYLDKIAKNIIKEGFILSKGDLSFLFEILFPISNYSYIFNKYSPMEIITTYESSCVVSLLTKYCHLNNSVHTNFMHGEKLLSYVNVLGFFDNMYVWDKHYEHLFKKLKYDCSNYIIYNPWICTKLPLSNNCIDFTFYLNFESESNLTIISKIVYKLEEKGFIVKIRPHPTQKNDKKLMRIINKKNIDYEENILQSLSNSKYLISRFSTVLFQGYIFQKKIIIDDCSNINEFNKLKKMDYIMLSKSHILLSELLKGENILL